MNVGLSPSAVDPGPHPPGVFIENRNAYATIVVPTDPSPAEQYAAVDVQSVLHKESPE